MTNLPFRLAAVGMLAAMAAGCVAPGKSTSNYIPPDTDIKASNARTIDESFGVVWENLVSSLSGSFFVINNLSKDSGLINLSYSTNDPNEFVECGTTERTFTYRDESLKYVYDPSEDASFKTAQEVPTSRTIVSNVRRSTNLEGRINVYVREVEPGNTRVRVNTRYILTVNVDGMQRLYSPAGVIQDSQRITPPDTPPITFNTKSTGRENWGTVEDPAYVECVATGALEKRVLDSL